MAGRRRIKIRAILRLDYGDCGHFSSAHANVYHFSGL